MTKTVELKADDMNCKESAASVGAHHCDCCPYGFHIDADFLHYCEALVQTFQASSPANGNRHQQFGNYGYAPSPIRETRSLPRRARLLSLSRSNTNEPLPLLCDCKLSTGAASSSSSLHSDSIASSAFNSRSISLPCDDSALNDVVEKFEEVLREQRRRAHSKHRRRVPDSLPVNARENVLQLDSPPASPASCLSSTITTPHTREDISQLFKARELDEQLKVLPLLRQKLSVLREEQYSALGKARDVAGSFRSETKSATPLSTNELRHVDCSRDVPRSSTAVSVATATYEQADASVATDSHIELTVSPTECISIPSVAVPVETVKTRSIGISTNFAPSLPRKLEPGFLRRYASEEAAKSFLSVGCDPIVFPANKQEAGVQAQPAQQDRKSSTDVVESHDVAVPCAEFWNLVVSETQTEQILRADHSTQVSGQCVKCELKQTETVAVGENCVFLSDKETATDIVEAQDNSDGPHLCEKCKGSGEVESIEPEKQSPVVTSKIPRLSLPPMSPKASRSNQIIIEEGANEILVYRNPATLETPSKHRACLPQMMARKVGQLEEACKIETDSTSDSDSDSSEEGTYELETSTISREAIRKRIERKEITQEMKAALKVLNDSLQKPDRASKSATIKSIQIIEKEWFRIAASAISDSVAVEDYLDYFERLSTQLLNYVVNMADSNGNTAMHYAISHSNFDTASVLLDSKVCDVNKQNKAGYSAVMLVSLAKVGNETQKAVIRRLFQLGDVNTRADQNGQTSLMLAASHGQFVTCKLLIEAGAGLNVQDKDGSTALMCAAEHGHTEIVRLLLSHPDCDPLIHDNEGATALSIAMASGNKDIGLMLYASSNMLSRGSSPYASLRRSQSKAIASSLRRTGSFTARPKRRSDLPLAPSPPSRSRSSTTTKELRK